MPHISHTFITEAGVIVIVAVLILVLVKSFYPKKPNPYCDDIAEECRPPNDD